MNACGIDDAVDEAFLDRPDGFLDLEGDDDAE